MKNFHDTKSVQLDGSEVFHLTKNKDTDICGTIIFITKGQKGFSNVPNGFQRLKRRSKPKKVMQINTNAKQ